MRQCLYYHLEGDAKDFYKIIPQKPSSWQQLIQSLKQQYGTSPCEEHEAKKHFFNSKQQAGESFQNFALDLAEKLAFSTFQKTNSLRWLLMAHLQTSGPIFWWHNPPTWRNYCSFQWLRMKDTFWTIKYLSNRNNHLEGREIQKKKKISNMFYQVKNQRSQILSIRHSFKKCCKCNISHFQTSGSCPAFGRIYYRCHKYNHFARCCKTHIFHEFHQSQNDSCQL